jgi:vacuolar-type H+-ATPase subunit H
MTSAIEETVKALTEFESELDRVKAEASETKRRMLKDVSDWAASAKANAVAKAQELAADRVAKARAEAEGDADSIKKKGEASLKTLEASISKHKSKAADMVVARLMGGAE